MANQVLIEVDRDQFPEITKINDIMQAYNNTIFVFSLRITYAKEDIPKEASPNWTRNHIKNIKNETMTSVIKLLQGRGENYTLEYALNKQFGVTEYKPPYQDAKRVSSSFVKTLKSFTKNLLERIIIATIPNHDYTGLILDDDFRSFSETLIEDVSLGANDIETIARQVPVEGISKNFWSIYVSTLLESITESEKSPLNKVILDELRFYQEESMTKYILYLFRGTRITGVFLKSTDITPLWYPWLHAMVHSPKRHPLNLYWISLRYIQYGLYVAKHRELLKPSSQRLVEFNYIINTDTDKIFNIIDYSSPTSFSKRHLDQKYQLMGKLIRHFTVNEQLAQKENIERLPYMNREIANDLVTLGVLNSTTQIDFFLELYNDADACILDYARNTNKKIEVDIAALTCYKDKALDLSEFIEMGRSITSYVIPELSNEDISVIYDEPAYYDNRGNIINDIELGYAREVYDEEGYQTRGFSLQRFINEIWFGSRNQ